MLTVRRFTVTLLSYMPNTQCPHCSKQYKVPQNAAGRGTNCLHCGKSFVIEFIEAPATQAAATGPKPKSLPIPRTKKRSGGGESSFEQVDVPEQLRPAFDEQPSESPTVHIDQGFDAEVVDINEVDDFIDVDDLVKEYDKKKAKPPTMFKPLDELAAQEPTLAAIPVSDTPSHIVEAVAEDSEEPFADSSLEAEIEADETAVVEEETDDSDISIEPDTLDQPQEIEEDEHDTSAIEEIDEDVAAIDDRLHDTEIDLAVPAKQHPTASGTRYTVRPATHDEVSMVKFSTIAFVLAAMGVGLGWAVFTFLR